MVRLVRAVRWFIVWFLVNLCGALDAIPWPRRNDEQGWHWSTAQWGCYPFRLALLSDRLDQRWKTGVWEDVAPKEEPPSD